MKPRLSLSLIIVVLSSTLIACTPWPEEGRGGFAERRPISSSSSTNLSPASFSPASSELSNLADRLQSAIERGARNSYAAQTAEAELQLTRAQRTWDAGFVEDYIKDYQVLVVLVQDVEAHVSGSNRQSRKRAKQGNTLSD